MAHSQRITMSSARQQAAQRLQAHMRRYGYHQLETPIIEAADLFLTKAGDQLIHKLFTFERYGKQLALRPEFTAIAAHEYALRQTQEIVRWQFQGAIFEDDPTDYQHSYQRYSLGAELIGMAGAAADVEIMAMAVNGVRALGLDDWKLVIGHTGLTRRLLSPFNLDERTERWLLRQLNTPGRLAKERPLEAEVSSGSHDERMWSEDHTQIVLDALMDTTQRGMTMGGRTHQEITQRLLQKRRRATDQQQVNAALSLLERWAAINAPPEQALEQIRALVHVEDQESQQLLDDWQDSFTLLSAYDIREKVVVQPHIVRSWDYYTGIVFEIRSSTGDLLAGGGRYDELVKLVGGRGSVPAIGFAYYFDTLLNAVAAEADLPENQVTIGFASAHTAYAASQWGYWLRQRGFNVVLYPHTQEKQTNNHIIINEDGLALFHGAAYSVDQLEKLAEELLQDALHD